MKLFYKTLKNIYKSCLLVNLVSFLNVTVKFFLNTEQCYLLTTRVMLCQDADMKALRLKKFKMFYKIFEELAEN